MWHCIAGMDFAVSVTSETHFACYWSYNSTKFLLWKSKDSPSIRATAAVGRAAFFVPGNGVAPRAGYGQRQCASAWCIARDRMPFPCATATTKTSGEMYV